jgi:tetratricopeptide (TPR) repeat protein
MSDGDAEAQLRTIFRLKLLVTSFALFVGGLGATPAAEQVASEIRIVAIEGERVEISPDGGANWITTQTNQVLKPSWLLRTGPNTRVSLRCSEQSVLSFGALTEIEILPPHTPEALSGLHLIQGIFSFFHRDRPGLIRILTKGTAAGVEGTELVMEVDAAQRTTLSVIDGQVRFTNDYGALTLTNGQQAVADTGQAPRPTSGFVANNILQWCFYYPGVLDLGDLPLTAQEQGVLSESLAAYRTGDLLHALARYPTGRSPRSDAERVYYAALQLSVGQVEQAKTDLAQLQPGEQTDRLQRLANALRLLISAVKRQTSTVPLAPLPSPLSTELLAASYYEQSRAMGEESLRAALALARQAATNSPEFSFAWERMAELEFSFGRTAEALGAVTKSLELAPRNAQTLALKGFLLAAQNRPREALDWFNQAIGADSALGNAWLGRGLCKIRSAPIQVAPSLRSSVPASALEDLLIAAALEPQRSLLRSYLGKAYASSGDFTHAAHELELARKLDYADPTAWLYSALFNRDDNRINEAIRDLEKSVELNENRRLFRSRFLLDEDRAVRSSSLANIYQTAGMDEVSLWEAARAVSFDYANYSAHHFLADSYDALRDPTRFNLRYETPWFNEWLLANMLSPVGGTPLAQHISQQEYARFFERDRVGLVSQTEYRSDGQVREISSQFGNYRNTGYAVDIDYQHNDGVRPNNQLDRLEVYGTIKQQITPQDSLLFLTKFENYHSGDNFQYYEPTNSRPDFHFVEYQTPALLIGGYHREWSPGIHTLVLGGRLQNDQRVSDNDATNYITVHNTSNQVAILSGTGFDVRYRSELDVYTAELNQIFQGHGHTLVFGARYQNGTFMTRDQLTIPSSTPNLTNFFNNPAAATNVDAGFERVAGYGYWTWEIVPNLLLTPGVTYDWLRYPLNFRHPPVAGGEQERDLLGFKGALVWSPIPELTLRGAYSHSLGGAGDDQSIRLEPTQLAGFQQAYRSVMPESFVGSVAAPAFQLAGLGLDLKLKTGTYVTLQGQAIQSELQQTIGTFDSAFLPFFAQPSSLRESLDYHEQTASAVVNQLVSAAWSLGAFYHFAHAELDRRFPDVPLSIPGGGNAKLKDEGDLHQPGFFVLFNHPSGWFTQFDLRWYIQNSSTANYPNGQPVMTTLPGESLPMMDLLFGYRFKRQRAELTIGVQNLLGEDYHLNPINLYEELPRQRVFYARLRFRL